MDEQNNHCRAKIFKTAIEVHSYSALPCAPNLLTSQNKPSCCGYHKFTLRKNPSGSKPLALDKGKSLTQETGRRKEYRDIDSIFLTRSRIKLLNSQVTDRLHQDAIHGQSSFSICYAPAARLP